MLIKQAFWQVWTDVLANTFEPSWVRASWTMDCIVSWINEDGHVQATIACPWPLDQDVWVEAMNQCEALWPNVLWSVVPQLAVTARALVGTQQPIPKVKNVIGVVSGKGGVGKSTVAAGMAKALAAMGASVGVMDADVYGPSMPYLFDCADQIVKSEGRAFVPHRAHGCVINSMGSLIAAEDPLIWRGPMASKAVEQLAYQTSWPSLDYLIVDMPPGTGDVAITCAKKIPMQAVVVVSTPHQLARLDVVRCVNMYKKLEIPILGVVENMAYASCDSCHVQYHPFGEGLRDWCEAHQLALLAQCPVQCDPAGNGANWSGLAMQMAAGLCCLQKRVGVNIPPVVAQEVNH